MEIMSWSIILVELSGSAQKLHYEMCKTLSQWLLIETLSFVYSVRKNYVNHSAIATVTHYSQPQSQIFTLQLIEFPLLTVQRIIASSNDLWPTDVFIRLRELLWSAGAGMLFNIHSFHFYS